MERALGSSRRGGEKKRKQDLEVHGSDKLDRRKALRLERAQRPR